MWSISRSAHPRHRTHPAQGSGLASLPWRPEFADGREGRSALRLSGRRFPAARPSPARGQFRPTRRQVSERAEPDGAVGSGVAAAGLTALSSGGVRAVRALPVGHVGRVRRRPARGLRQGVRGAARGCPAGIRAPSRTGRRCGPPSPAFPADGCPASPTARTGRPRSPVARLGCRTPGSSSVAVVFVGFPEARA